MTKLTPIPVELDINVKRLLQEYMPLFTQVLFVLATTIGAFVGGLWGAVGIGGALLLFFGTWTVDHKMPTPSKELVGLALLVVAVFAVELPLSSQTAISVHTFGHLASIFLPLTLLSAPALQVRGFSPRLIPVASVAACIGALALGAELLSGGYLLHSLKGPNASLTEYNRGIAHLVILSFPLLAGLWVTGRKRMAVILFVVLLFPAGLTDSRTAKMALIAGAGVMGLAQLLSKATPRLLAVFPFALLSWPFAAAWAFKEHVELVDRLPPSWRHRVEIWDYLSYRIAERPWFGWGLGTTNKLDFHSPHSDLYQFATQAAPHAHNLVTELWVETGVPGLALGTMFLLFTLREALKLRAELRPFALGGWMAAIVVSLVGFNWWTDALWAAFALSAFVFGGLNQSLSIDPIERKGSVGA